MTLEFEQYVTYTDSESEVPLTLRVNIFVHCTSQGAPALPPEFAVSRIELVADEHVLHLTETLFTAFFPGASALIGRAYEWADDNFEN